MPPDPTAYAPYFYLDPLENAGASSLMQMWNNIETLRAFSQGLTWAAGVFAVTAAIATGVRYYVDRRVSELSTQARTMEAERKESAQADREAALRTQLEATELKLRDSSTKLASLEEKTRPRLLSDPQRQQLIAALTNCPAKVVSLTAPLGDPEAFAFAKHLDSAFEAAGWKSSGVSQAVFTGVPVGLILRVASKEHLHPCASLVQQAFAAIGIQAPGEIVAGSPTEVLDILVGHKP